MKRGIDSESIGNTLLTRTNSNNLIKSSIYRNIINEDSRCNLYEEDEVDDFVTNNDSSQQNLAYLRSVQEAMSSIYNNKSLSENEVKLQMTEPLLSSIHIDDRKCIVNGIIFYFTIKIFSI